MYRRTKDRLPRKQKSEFACSCGPPGGLARLRADISEARAPGDTDRWVDGSSRRIGVGRARAIVTQQDLLIFWWTRICLAFDGLVQRFSDSLKDYRQSIQVPPRLCATSGLALKLDRGMRSQLHQMADAIQRWYPTGAPKNRTSYSARTA